MFVFLVFFFCTRARDDVMIRGASSLSRSDRGPVSRVPGRLDSRLTRESSRKRQGSILGEWEWEWGRGQVARRSETSQGRRCWNGEAPFLHPIFLPNYHPELHLGRADGTMLRVAIYIHSYTYRFFFIRLYVYSETNQRYYINTSIYLCMYL